MRQISFLKENGGISKRKQLEALREYGIELEEREEGDGRATLAHFLGVNSKEEFAWVGRPRGSLIYSSKPPPITN